MESGAKPAFSDSQLPVGSPTALLAKRYLCKQCIQGITALQTMYFTIFITSKVGTRVLGLFMLLIIPTFMQKCLRPKHSLKESTMALFEILFPERCFLFFLFKDNHWLLPSSVQSLYCCCYIINTENPYLP